MNKPGFSIPLHYQIIITLIAGGFFGYFFPDATIYTNWIGSNFSAGTEYDNHPSDSLLYNNRSCKCRQ